MLTEGRHYKTACHYYNNAKQHCYRNSRACYLEYLGAIKWYGSRRVHDSHTGKVFTEITHVQLVLNLWLEWSRDPTIGQRHPVQPLHNVSLQLISQTLPNFWK